MIYHHGLFVGTVSPYNQESNYTELPSAALLPTCRAVYAEAEPAIFRNIFRFSTAASLKRFLERDFKDHARRTKIVSIEINFEWTGFEDEQADRVVDSAYERQFDEDILGVVGGGRASLIKHLHRVRKIVMRDEVWQSLADQILTYLRPRNLFLDISKSRDVSNCCALKTSALCTLWPGFASGMPLEYLKIKGLHGFQDSETMNAADELLLTLVKIWTLARNGDAANIPAAWIEHIGYDAEDFLLEEIKQEEESTGVAGGSDERVEFSHDYCKA